jgi:hypothetical protein
VLAATDGSRTIAQARAVFHSIGKDFKAIVIPAASTPLMMFFLCNQNCRVGSACVPGERRRWAELYGTQDQVVQFAIDYGDILNRNRHTTWFPFQCQGRYFAAGIHQISGGKLEVRLQAVGYLQSLDFSDGRNQVVILQPALLVNH